MSAPPLEVGGSVGKAVACCALAVPRASLYRRMQPTVPRRVRRTPARAFTAALSCASGQRHSFAVFNCVLNSEHGREQHGVDEASSEPG